VTLTKARIICFLFTAAPLALTIARLSLGTKTGGLSDGGGLMA
jgi:hypothetical protein